MHGQRTLLFSRMRHFPLTEKAGFTHRTFFFVLYTEFSIKKNENFNHKFNCKDAGKADWGIFH